jgi:hypothetical protein
MDLGCVPTHKHLRLQLRQCRLGFMCGWSMIVADLKCRRMHACACKCAISWDTILDASTVQGVCLAGLSEADDRKVREWLQQMEPGLPTCCVSDDMLYKLLGASIYDSDREVRLL